MDRDEDNITDQERDISQNALTEFKKKNYGSCLQQLNLLENKAHDFKVMHNKAVIEFYKSDLKKIDAFQANLNSINNKHHIKIEKLDDVDHCIAYYNQAVVLYHQRQYTASQRIMEKVYKFIEPMEDSLAKQVSLLAIELQLCMRQPDKALTLISYLENNVLNEASPTKGPEKKSRDKDKKITGDNLEEFRKKLIKYKIRCSLMSHNLTKAGKEIQLLSKGKNNIDYLFMSAHLEYLKGNIQESLKIVKSIDEDSLNYNDCSESSMILCNNNIGILMHALGKPNLACHYFQEAIKKDMAIHSDNKKESNDKSLYYLGGSKYHELMYNLGIAMLHAGKAAQAFECLIIAVRRYHRNSRLWTRLAECCIMVHKATNEVDFDVQKKQKEIIVDVIGTKEKQKIVINSYLSNDKKYSCDSQSYAVPVPSLEFALLCLRNAQILIPTDSTSNSAPMFLVAGISPPAPLPNPGPAPSNPLSPDTLCLGDYILALEHARNLLAQPKMSGIHKLLAHMYAAESLVLLENINEALDHLDPENIKDISFNFPTDGGPDEVKTGPPPKWFPTSLGSAHAVLQYNIAVAKTIRGQLDQASALLKQVWSMNKSCRVPAHIIMLVIYIELKLGHADIARNLIKQHYFHHRING